jgi:4-amino-4-deoxy-L-arabinose transferase-like glycosyltransferase
VLSRSAGVALAAGLGMALNPSLFYFESYLLYEPLVIFLLTASVWALWRALAGGSRRWLAVYLALLNALVMTRTLYHLIYIFGGLAAAWPLLKTLRWRRRMAAAALAVALPAGWYGKNLVQYGFFGSSSWYGFGLYKCVETQWPQKELLALIQQGALPRELSAGSAYDHKISYYRQYGYDKPAAVALLGRDDLHNINVPALSRTLFKAAKRLIALDPWRYLKAVHLSYQRFCRPPSRFAQLVGLQRDAFIGWEPLVADWLYGKAITDAVEIPTRVDLGSLFYFYFPALMMGGAWWAARRGRMNPVTGRDGGLEPTGEDRAAVNAPPESGYQARARAALMAYFVYACLYVATIGTMMESGENERFRFATEPMTLIVVLMGGRSIMSRLIRPAAARYRAG